MKHDSRDAPGGSGAAAPDSWQAERAARERAEAEASRLSRLQTVTAGFSGARTPSEVAEVALSAGVPAIGGTRGFVLVADASGELDLLRCAGVREEPARLAASAIPGPATDAFRTGAPVLVEDAACLAARYPALAAAAAGFEGAIAALPLVIEGRPLGVLAVAFDGARAFDETDRALAAAIAAHCAQALERARLFASERVARAEAVAARRRLAFLDGVSAHLAEAADERQMMDGIARLSVATLGDWVAVFTLSESGSLARQAGSGPATLGEAVEAHLGGAARSRFERACGEGELLLLDDFPADPAGARAVPYAAVLPLVVRDRSLGALVVATADPRRVPGPADLSLAADVAHRTALAVAHARLLEEATVAARAREEFLNVASHELRGPLGTLRLTVQLMRRQAAAGDLRGHEERLRLLERQAQRLVRLSESLLDVSRITAGRLEILKDEGDLAAVVGEVAARFAEEASERGSAIEVHAPEPVPCAFDAARVEQIVSNLLSNAVKYGRGGAIQVRVGRRDGSAHVEVEDHGIGIAAEDRERIFGRFERAVSGRSYGGLGLGLWIARRIVEAHGGTVRVRSEPGSGSTFRVELPLPSSATTA